MRTSNQIYWDNPATLLFSNRVKFKIFHKKFAEFKAWLIFNKGGAKIMKLRHRNSVKLWTLTVTTKVLSVSIGWTEMIWTRPSITRLSRADYHSYHRTAVCKSWELINSSLWKQTLLWLTDKSAPFKRIRIVTV